MDKITGEPKKMTFGPWIFSVFKLLAKFKFLRGTPFDPFGYSKERKTERQLIGDYEAVLEEVLAAVRSPRTTPLRWDLPAYRKRSAALGM